MQKMILFITGLVCAAHSARAQIPLQQSPHPITWHCWSEETGNNIFRLHLTAFIQPGWHLYSQHQPGNAIAVPTAINFNTNNTAIHFEGKTKEIGKMQKYENPALDIAALQYSDSVDFVQTVKTNTSGLATVSGDITYQVCRENECLRPVTESFNLEINNK